VSKPLFARRASLPHRMTDDNQLSFKLPSVSRKKVTAALDRGQLSSDGGVMLLALADRRRKVADTLAAHIADRRDPSHITHTVADVLRARILAIGCGYPDGNDFDWLRCDAAFKLACGRLPDSRRRRVLFGERAPPCALLPDPRARSPRTRRGPMSGTKRSNGSLFGMTSVARRKLYNLIACAESPQ
jgi:Transposase DDE domain group 1